MIDPLLLRENPDAVRASQRLRGSSVQLVDDALAADLARRTAIAAYEADRAEQNAFGKVVAAAPKDQKAALVAEAQSLAARVKAGQQKAADAEADFARIAGSIQNIVIDGVPAGGEDDFVTLKTVGAKPVFDPARFPNGPLDHLAIGEKLDAIDMA
ncbi:MAG: serine--tRNA ligase, partial [Leifsonia sp.]|nr:serine--tRNA ligase [Leifsonia sp.]